MNLPTALIEYELKSFEARFKEAAKSNAPLLDRIMRYIVKRKGKQLRIDCRTCGRRFFDLKLAIAAKKVREDWSRDDVRRKFSCNRGKRKKSPPPCAINTVAFEVRFQDFECFGS